MVISKVKLCRLEKPMLALCPLSCTKFEQFRCISKGAEWKFCARRGGKKVGVNSTVKEKEEGFYGSICIQI